ncbi:unnamed protein product [Wuchereria bancrofti]|uniref:Uncharacterized protein n=1 Tax=Wuchereria bancrofti TaxID=6293 RepID=A0A3P7FB61_WUCBA|nr:unnamed protein product [Wuchereria bancrofti]
MRSCETFTSGDVIRFEVAVLLCLCRREGSVRQGADIAALVHEAGIIAMQESISGSNTDGCRRVTMKHFQNAAQRIRPSVPEKDRLVYRKLKEMYGKLRSE